MGFLARLHTAAFFFYPEIRCGVSHRWVQRVGIAYLINDFGEGFVRRFKSLIGYTPHKNVSKSKPAPGQKVCPGAGYLLEFLCFLYNVIKQFQRFLAIGFIMRTLIALETTDVKAH